MFPIEINYFIWIPVEIVFYSVVAYLSKKNNNNPQLKRFFVAMVCLNLIPLWSFVAPDSKNLAFDGLLYDTITVLVMTVVLALLGSGSSFQKQNWLGVGVIIVGFILMNV